ncbi:hypothetical protein BN1013_00075 [Candidatus Rubidus massiliensis]|nr:hypothetical protein BN1013_00075 [Candidatus Rubidus massiliensis]
MSSLLKIPFYQNIAKTLEELNNEEEKIAFLMKLPNVSDFFSGHPSLILFAKNKDPQQFYCFLSLLAIDQGDIIFQNWDQIEDKQDRWDRLQDSLKTLEENYSFLGGIVGYHCQILQMIAEKDDSVSLYKTKFIHPPWFDIRSQTKEVDSYIKLSLQNAESIAEFYPIGGAGDRLNLIDEENGKPLPAAMLQFQGKTLLEGLIKDLEAREYLVYKLFGKQIITPIALMTSLEKDNDYFVKKIIEKNNWFGRPKDSFLIFTQPLIPMITVDGQWAVSSPLELILKPGGHGVIWKLAKQKKVFDQLLSRGIKKALFRQINNPLANTDYALYAFLGIGIFHNKHFGFASCPRLVNTAEGMNVLVQKETECGVCYSVSNIEYTEFMKLGIEDKSLDGTSNYSIYPANTNILFADIEKIQDAITSCPLPGMLINMKTKINCLNKDGDNLCIEAGRLESLMQNIADCVINVFSEHKQITQFDLNTYLTFNDRNKTISVTKKLQVENNHFHETPKGAFFDILKNYEEVLSKYSKIKMPKEMTVEKFLEEGPSLLVNLIPSLGPLNAIVGQKIRGGSIQEKSELHLEIAEIEIENLTLDGSLVILASKQTAKLSNRTGRCLLKNVKIKNKGVNWEASEPIWKGNIERLESFKVILEGFSEFEAENIEFIGNFEIIVPDGYRYCATLKDGLISIDKIKINSPKWEWKYSFNENDAIELIKVNY